MADFLDDLGGQPSASISEPSVRKVRHVHRVDPRLVHATLLEAWVPYLDVKHLIVADREVAEDPRRKTIFAMSARDIQNTYFIDEVRAKDAIRNIPSDESAIVVYGSLQSFVEALNCGLKCTQMIVGHLPVGEDKWRVHPSVYLGDEEFDLVEYIRNQGVEVVVRPLPSDHPMGLRRDEEGRPILTELPGTTDLVPTTETSQKDAQAPITKTGTVSVVNERGLHLRAAHVLAQCAGQYKSTIEVTSDGRTVNAKSLLGLTTLGAALGAILEVKVTGEDAETAYTAVTALFARGFEEGLA